jgi:hypothetical protein
LKLLSLFSLLCLSLSLCARVFTLFTHAHVFLLFLLLFFQGIVVAFISLPLHEMRPYQDKRQMTTEKAAAEQHMKDLAEQEKQYKASQGKKKK